MLRPTRGTSGNQDSPYAEHLNLGRAINYVVYGIVGFLIGAVFKLWLDIGLDPSQFGNEPLIGPVWFGIVGAIVLIINAWFL